MPECSQDDRSASPSPNQKSEDDDAVTTGSAVVTKLDHGPTDARLKRLVRLLARQAAEEFLRNAVDGSSAR